MAGKLTQNETNTCSCAENTSTPTNKSSSARYVTEEVQARLQDAPVPSEFKQALKGVISDPQLSSISLMNSVDSGVGDSSESAIPPLAMVSQSIESKARSENASQSFFLTETMVNLAGLENATLGLQQFDGRSLSALVTNTYFLESCFYPPIYWCPVPDEKTPCNGMYVSYSEKDKGLVDDLIKIMASCGLSAELQPADQWCGTSKCCRQVGVGGGGKVSHRRVVLTNRANIPWRMSRIAAMIDGAIAPPKAKEGKSAFCLAVNSMPAAIDWYSRSPNEDSQFNPQLLPAEGSTQPYKGGSAPTDPLQKTFQRTRCDLLAHVIAENFWGRNCYDKYKDYYYAHRLALIEENWIRKATGRPQMLWQLDSQGNEVKGLPGKTGNNADLQRMEEQLNKLCKSFGTVTCTNNCPGGRCCADSVTPFGWTSCKDICNC